MALLNRAKMTTSTTGTGTVTLGSASSGYFTFAEAGAVDGQTYTYVIEDGADFEIGIGAYTSSGTTFSRATVYASKIAGSAGTSKINLSGSATIAIVPALADLREKLIANRTYYVRTDGNDSNSGLANSSGGAFLTIQKALDVCATLDFGGFTVTVQVADGTYTGAVSIGRMVGQLAASNLVIQGNSGTPANVIISTTSNDCFATNAIGAMCTVKDMELRTTTAGSCLRARYASVIAFTNLRFGAAAAPHMVAQNGRLEATGNYTISGSASIHWQSDGAAAAIEVGVITITLSGTPAFSTAFASASTGGVIRAFSNTYSGSATGARYSVTVNGILQTFGAGATALPGNASGSTATGGVYA